MELYTIAALAGAFFPLHFGALGASVLESRSVSNTYPCDEFEGKTIYCQNFVADYDELIPGQAVDVYDNLTYSFQVQSPQWFVGRSARFLKSAILPKSGKQFIYTEGQSSYLQIASSAAGDYYALLDIASFYFACSKPGTQRAVPCTVTLNADVEDSAGTATFDFKPKTFLGKTTMQYAKLPYVFRNVGYFLFEATGVNGSDVSLFLDNFKYNVTRAPYV